MDAAGNLLDGHMTKWNETTGYDPDVKLETQMQVERPAGTVTGAQYEIILKQTVLLTDIAGDYEITISFTATIPT